MSGMTGLVDTLLADKLAQRADLVRLPDSSVIAEPAPTRRVAAVENDVAIQSDRSNEAPAPPVPAAAAATARAAGVQALSAAGHVIGVLLAEGGETAQPVSGTTPIAPDPAAPPAQLALALQQTLVRSGLFYESHLAALAASALAPEELACEPQSALARPPAGAAPSDRQAAAGSAAHLADASLQAVIHPAARPLVAQQLALLATGVFEWRGEAWPGVPMRWRVHEQDREAAEGHSGEPTWHTIATVQMPRLGEVELRLSLKASSLSVAVVAEAPAAADLRAQGSALTEALDGVGLAHCELAVRAREAA